MSGGAEEELVGRHDSLVGEVLAGAYRIDSLLGAGGMASVYAATHRSGKRVAIKMLHPELSMKSDIRARFLREGHAASSVHHPGVVVVLDDDVADDGAAFLVMELLEGKVIEALWKDHGERLPPKMVLAIARELCDVLEVAHASGIVHRDLKPENLFLTHEGRLKVLDFGLAQLRDVARPKVTTTGLVLGTPAFMSPEQADGRTSRIDHQTDLWAVGATMFTLLSGRIVHEGESAQRIVILAATSPARSLRAVMPDAAPALVVLVDRALAVDKTVRWQNAAAMRDAICETSALLYGERSPPIITTAEWRVTPRSSRRARSGDQTLPSTNTPTIDGASARSEYDDRTRIDDLLAVPDVTTERRQESRKLKDAIDHARADFFEAPVSVRISDDETRLHSTEGTLVDPSEQFEDKTAVNPPRESRPSREFGDLPSSQSRVPLWRPRLDVKPSGNSITPTIPDRPAVPASLVGWVKGRRGARLKIGLLALALVVLLGSVVLVTALAARRHRAGALGEAAPVPPPVVEAAPAPPEPAAASATEGPATPPVGTVGTDVSDLPAADFSGKLARTRPPPVVAHPPPAPATPSAAARQVRCTPPYEIDATGKKRWKLECL